MKKLIKIIILGSIFFLCGIIMSTHKCSAEELKSGEYMIKSAIDEKFVLDVTSASKSNGKRIELWQNKKGDNQIFKVEKVGNDLYMITAKHSSKSLDVPHSSKNPGTILEQYSCNGQDNQRWLIKSTNDGFYNIVSKCNGLYVDVEKAKATNGTNIILWNGNNGKNQKFKFERMDEDAENTDPQENNKPVEGEDIIIEDGMYQIKSALNNNFVLDVTSASKSDCAKLNLWQNKDGKNQKFNIKYIGNHCYTISNVNSGKYLDVEGGSKKNGANLIQYTYKGEDNQKWMIKSAGDGYYYLVSKCNNLCIDVANSKVSNGTNIVLWTQNGGKNQKFKLCKTGNGPSSDFKQAHPEIKIGIDVSKHQGEIDWNKVKADGIDYAMIRAGFRGYGEPGNLWEDEMFEKNVKDARAAGIDVGVYFFSQAKNYDEGVKEAEYTIKLIKKFDITYPVAFDTEASSSPTNTGRADNISVQDRTNATKGFCSTIKKAGYKPLIYASPYWIKDKLDISQLSDYKLWLANYTGATQEDPLKKPSSYKGKYVMWQYTDTGKVDGINGNVDCNIYFYIEDK